MTKWTLGLSLVTVLAGTSVHAQTPALVPYTIDKDTRCDDLALKLWGDRSKYTLIHANNPQLGPSPHLLKVGQVLHIPPPTVGAPDAHLDLVRNQVAIETPDTRPGKANDPLFRGNRVGTKESSLAEVGFRDDTKLWLGERSLVVILGDSRSQVGQGDEATLVNGSLRAFIGPSKRPLTIGSASATASVGAGEAQVTLDATKTTRLAQYQGTSAIVSAGRSTSLTGGFGSKAIDKTPPSPPKPLPLGPTWVHQFASLYAAPQSTVDVFAEYAETKGPGDPIAQFHVQLARDDAFHDLVVDTRVPVSVLRLDAKNVAAGSYFARVSAIDNDQFEGPYGVSSATEVVPIEGDAAPHAARIPIPVGRYSCSIDGGAFALVSAPLVVSRTRAHKIACSTDPSGANASSFDVTAEAFGAKVVDAAVTRKDDTSGTLTFKLTDSAGVSVPDAAVAIQTKDGLEMSAPVSLGDGRYTSEVRWKPKAVELSVIIDVNDLETAPTGSVPLPVEAAPPKPADPRLRGELAVAFDGAVINDTLASGDLGASFGFGIAMPLGKSTFAIGVRGSYARMVAAQNDRDVIEAAIPLTLRLGSARLRPTLMLAPLIARTGAGGRSEALLLGGEARLGADLAAGDGAFYINVGPRITNSVTTPEGHVSLTGLAASLGYRLSF